MDRACGEAAAATVAVRPFAERDMDKARDLLRQLGSDLDGDEVRRRVLPVTADPNHTVMVAERAGTVVGLCHMFARPALEKPPEAYVQALVVDAACRGGGIGRVLMAAAERWALDRGFDSVALASNVSRTEAHAFYAEIGYRHVATSHLFRRTLRTRHGGGLTDM
ncbi:MAG: GNAT family N-acetyltransferase [Acetobacteraceae bacterium]|nr:GNAT family N-acetyltransferase [Acetobacteraceae bacterium]